MLAGKDESKHVFEDGVAHYHFKNIPQAKRLLSQCIETCEYDQAARVYLKRCERFEKEGIHESTGEVDLELKWDNALAIGHPQIDAQHQRLFAGAKDFVNTIKDCDNYSQALIVIGLLSQSLTNHFRNEEKYMQDANYPFLKMQKQEHSSFQMQFDSLKNKIERDLKYNRISLLFRMQVLVVDWLINHTSGADQHFGKYLRMSKQLDK
jgi:hemerythrin-like metal-binding protein